jgi:SAM-dependent methyltransferase
MLTDAPRLARVPSSSDPRTQEAAATSLCWACGGPSAPTQTYRPVVLQQCASCGLIFAPQRTAGEAHDLYKGDDYFAHYPGGMVEESATSLRLQEARVRLRLVRRYVPSGRLLEIGAAGGHFLAEARRGGYDVIGIEPTDNAAAAARERFDLEVVQGFVEDVELPAGSLDVACAWHVIEHITEPLNALRHIRRWLKPAGYLVIEVPNLASHQARRKGTRWAMLHHDHHVAHYCPAAIRRLLERAGYEVRLVQTVAYTMYRPRHSPMAWVSAARQLALTRLAPWRPHASAYELMQVVAQAP